MCLPVLLLLRPSHSALDIGEQPRSTAFPAKPTQTNERDRHGGHKRDTGLRFVLLLCSENLAY